jgi:hypothetical protein
MASCGGLAIRLYLAQSLILPSRPAALLNRRSRHSAFRNKQIGVFLVYINPLAVMSGNL